MMGAKKPGAGPQTAERRSTRPPAPQASEKRIKVATKWSPTLPSAKAPEPEPDALNEAHAALADARAALDAAVMALDRIRSARRR